MVQNYFLGVFIRQNNVKRIISYLNIQNQKGELIYRFPFKDLKVNLDYKTKKLLAFPIDHITFHANGTVNLTPKKVGRKERKREVLEDSKTRLAIKEIGSQHLITDFVRNIDIYPTHYQKLDREIVFDLEVSIKSIFLRIDLLSGKNFIANEFYRIREEDEDGRYISKELVGLGPDSGNSDKVFIVSIFEYKKPQTISTIRRFFIPKFNGIPISTNLGNELASL